MSAKKFHETAEFKKLNKEWAKKLADSGFEDIEKGEDEYVVTRQEFTIPSGLRNNKQYKNTGDSSLIGNAVNPTEDLEPLMEYADYVAELGGLDHYEFCHAILRDFPFKRDLDRQIFELHTEGLSERDICDELSKRGLKVVDRSTVSRIIAKIKDQYQRG